MFNFNVLASMICLILLINQISADKKPYRKLRRIKSLLRCKNLSIKSIKGAYNEEIGNYCRCKDGSYGLDCQHMHPNPCTDEKATSKFFLTPSTIPDNHFIHCDNKVPFLFKCPSILTWDQHLLTCSLVVGSIQSLNNEQYNELFKTYLDLKENNIGVDIPIKFQDETLNENSQAARNEQVKYNDISKEKVEKFVPKQEISTEQFIYSNMDQSQVPMLQASQKEINQLPRFPTPETPTTEFRNVNSNLPSNSEAFGNNEFLYFPNMKLSEGKFEHVSWMANKKDNKETMPQLFNPSTSSLDQSDSKDRNLSRIPGNSDSNSNIDSNSNLKPNVNNVQLADYQNEQFKSILSKMTDENEDINSLLPIFDLPRIPTPNSLFDNLSIEQIKAILNQMIKNNEDSNINSLLPRIPTPQTPTNQFENVNSNSPSDTLSIDQFNRNSDIKSLLPAIPTSNTPINNANQANLRPVNEARNIDTEFEFNLPRTPNTVTPINQLENSETNFGPVSQYSKPLFTTNNIKSFDIINTKSELCQKIESKKNPLTFQVKMLKPMSALDSAESFEMVWNMIKHQSADGLQVLLTFPKD